MKFLVALCLLLSSPAWAQSLKVIKVKGSQAIVNVNNGSVDVGQVIKIPAAGEAGDEELELTGGSTGPRRHLIGIDTGEYRTGKDESPSGAGNTSTYLDLKARYGWNTGIMEYGAIGALGLQDTGTGNQTTFGGGGYFDFNFTPNKTGNDKIWGAGIEGVYLNTALPSGGGNSTTLQFFPSGFFKWFILKTPTALRVDVGYRYSEATTGSAKTKGSYVVAKAGFAVYF